jgi:hypothetical protein
MQEPPWLPRTEEEYRQQVAEDAMLSDAHLDAVEAEPHRTMYSDMRAMVREIRFRRAAEANGPQPDEMSRLQMDIDSAEEEIERLQGLLKIATTAFDVIEQDLGKLLGLTRTEQKIEATITLARKAMEV